MSAVIYARVPTWAGRLQVFIGDFGVDVARPLHFTLTDCTSHQPVTGAAAVPVPLRALSSVRGPGAGGAPAAGDRRAFVGTYEFGGLVPGRTYRVGVRIGEESLSLQSRVLPDRVPSDTDGGLDILLGSCFYRDEHSSGTLARALRQLVGSVRPKRGGGRSPDFALLMGDQVYLDLPTFKDFPKNPDWLARHFEENYRQNWQGSLAPVLASAPFACLPDDHEFWNNAPHPSPQNGNTYTVAGRRQWFEAAQANYNAFAKPLVASGEDSTDDPLTIDIAPLSFFLADGRSKRKDDRSFAFTPACRQALRAWVDRLNRMGHVGIFVSGQSLLSERVSDTAGKFADWEMPNYTDYAAILAELGRARQRLLLLTGDVHWGRVSNAMNRFTGEHRLQEVVVSPMSLVTTVGVDQAKRGWGWLKDLVGPNDPWPRHADASKPPAELRVGRDAASAYRCGLAARPDGGLAQFKGNQIGLLSFDWENTRLRARVTYFPIHEKITAPTVVPLFETWIAR
jgi:hypothetical protein